MIEFPIMGNSIVHITEQGYQDLQEELAAIQGKKRPQAVERVQRAREFGDLSENTEYHAAREDLNFIDGRVEELQDILRRARVMAKSRSRETVGLGCKVTVLTDGKNQVFTVVGDWEADPAEKKISHDSPLGKALMGRKAGDRIKVAAPAGSMVYLIKRIH